MSSRGSPDFIASAPLRRHSPRWYPHYIYGDLSATANPLFEAPESIEPHARRIRLLPEATQFPLLDQPTPHCRAPALPSICTHCPRSPLEHALRANSWPPPSETPCVPTRKRTSCIPPAIST